MNRFVTGLKDVVLGAGKDEGLVAVCLWRGATTFVACCKAGLRSTRTDTLWAI